MAIGVSFKIAQHTVRKCPIVEVFMDDVFVATVTPNEAQDGINVISKHFDNVTADTAGGVDAVHIEFKVRS